MVPYLPDYNGPDCFEGTLRSFRLESNNECYGPCPEPNDIVEQHLSVHRDGRFRLSAYRFGDGNGLVRAATIQRKIRPEQAEQIFLLLEQHFAENTLQAFVTDVGSWDLELVNSDNTRFRYSGSLVSDEKLSCISNIIRSTLKLDDLFCFDGNELPDEKTIEK